GKRLLAILQSSRLDPRKTQSRQMFAARTRLPCILPCIPGRQNCANLAACVSFPQKVRDGNNFPNVPSTSRVLSERERVPCLPKVCAEAAVFPNRWISFWLAATPKVRSSRKKRRRCSSASTERASFLATSFPPSRN